jgi:hypothetical protein
VEIAGKFRNNKIHWSKYWASILSEKKTITYGLKEKSPEVLYTGDQLKTKISF